VTAALSRSVAMCAEQCSVKMLDSGQPRDFAFHILPGQCLLSRA
jgi:hypothetical protein